MNYTRLKRKLLTVIFALDKFCSYLIDSFTIFYYDHATVRHLMSKQDIKPRLILWILLFQDNHGQKSAENMVVGHISRFTNESLIDTTPINDSFTNEFLFSMYNMPWYANIIIILQ